jgi:hypothetical protein
VTYYYTGTAGDPDIVGRSHCGYDFLSIFAEMWEQRKNCCSSGTLFDDFGDYAGRRFLVSGIGRKFDGDDGRDDKAFPPWHWKDNDDAPWRNGDWFMDPASYHLWQFNWSEDFSDQYILHPLVNYRRPGDIYNGRGDTTTPR